MVSEDRDYYREALVELFDAEREAALGEGARLALLRFESRGSDQVATYTSVKVVDGGWKAYSTRGQDGAVYAKVEIVDLDGDMAEALDGESPATDFAIIADGYPVSGQVHKIAPDKVERPLGEPPLYKISGYRDTKDEYAG